MDTSGLAAAIPHRRSRRAYKGNPIEPHLVSNLRTLIAKCNSEGDLRMELITNQGKAFNGFTKSYGMFSGVNDYIALIAAADDPQAVERLGYYGEIVVLHATTLGLGTCWVGGSFSRNDISISLLETDVLVCVITIGNTLAQDTMKESLIRRLTHRSSKKPEDMYTADVTVPEWFQKGMNAVCLAPSAVNRQPVSFSYNNGAVSASIPDYAEAMMALDFGIAKLHFMLGAGGGTWEWGNHGVLRKSALDY